MQFSFKDWDLLDLKSDLHVLQAHLDFVVEQVPLQTEKHERVLEEKLRRADYDDDEYGNAMAWNDIQDHNQWVEEGLPRLIVNPFVVAVWSVYESVMFELARLIQGKRGVPLGLSDISGNKGLVARVDKYFTHVLHFPVALDDERKDRLNRLGAIRNAVVHSNGKLSGLKKPLQAAIREGKVEGLETSGDGVYFVCGVDYARSAYDTVKEHLDILFESYEGL